MGYDPSTPNEVGEVLFHDGDGMPHTGLLLVTTGDDVSPVSIELVDEAIADEFEFIITLSPAMAHFFGALQAHENGGNVPKNVLVAGDMLWRLGMRTALLEWRELLRERDG